MPLLCEASHNKGTIEYDDVEVEIPAGAISDESGTNTAVTVHITAIEETEIPKTDNLIIGKTYAFNLIDENNQPQQKVEFGYDKEMIPEGYSEFDLAVYHYDVRYANWVKMENAEIDPLENKIRIQTNHFSMLSVQLNPNYSPDAEQYKDLGLSPYQTYFQDNQEIVSPASGNLILNTVDISILGRNGLDLIIGRTYDNTTAVLESLADQDLKDSKKVYHTFGTGWSLNISSIETNENGQYLYFEDGSPCKLEWEMDGNGMDGGGHGTVEYHEGHHFVGEKVQNKVKDVKFLIIKVGEEWDDAETIISRKDGKLYYFDGEGKILSIVDQTGNNKIEFFYNDKKLDKILDTIGREIDFKYNEKGKIENITSSEINYRYEYDEVEVIYGYKEIWNQQLKYRTRILDELDWTEGDYKYKEPLRYIVWVISVQ